MIINIPRHNTDETRELRGLFERKLRELYWVEQKLYGTIKNIAAEAFSKDLVALLDKHTAETMLHVSRLEKIFEIIGLEPEEKKYKAVVCLFNETLDFLAITKKGVVRDAGIISVLQKIKHHEIASYGTMKAYAIALRDEDAVMLLEETLENEKKTDMELSAIAESHINTEAADKEI